MQYVKKSLSLALVLVMLLSCLPANALATSTTSATQDDSTVQNTAPENVAMNATSGKYYASVLEALTASQVGEKVVLLQDAAVTSLVVFSDVTLDLNGHTLNAAYVSSYGDIVDSSADNSGLLEVSPNRILIREKNKQMPVYDGSGYRFVKVSRIDTAYVAAKSMFAFQPRFEAGMLELLKQGQKSTGVTIQVQVSWKQGQGYRTQKFIYNDSFVQEYLNSYNASADKYSKMFTLTLNGAENFEELTFTAIAVSQIGVTFSSADPIEEDDEIYSGIAAIQKGALVYGTLAEDVTIGSAEGVNAVLPATTKVADNADALVLSVKKAETGNEITLGIGESAQSLDVHIAGIAADNKVPVTVNLGAILKKGLSDTELKLYHIEDGVAVLMTRVPSTADFAIHNQYTYDPETGEVSIYVASFSVFSAVETSADKWDGSADTSWYNENDNEFTLTTAEQFAGFGSLVDGGNTFEGKTVKLGVDIDLNKIQFDPIGFDYVHLGGQAFMGTFDGQNHTVYNLAQNGWELDSDKENYSTYTYSTAGGGLFASIKDATIKNLAVCGAQIVFECVDIGIVVGYAQGTCHFENIVVSNSTIANYNRATGGVVGEVCFGPYGTDTAQGYSHTFKNIVVDSSVTVSSLWGSFDTLCGGVIGGKWGDATVKLENITVACKLDVFSDVTAAYQWYTYRRCGMLIGHTEQNSPKKALNAAAPFLTCENVEVYYGDWVNYTYYEFPDQDSDTGRRYPWVRAEAGLHNAAFSNPRYGVPTYGGEKITDGSKASQKADITFNQLYGGGQGVYGASDHIGVSTFIKSAKTVYIQNDQGWENLKLQYWFKHNDDIWSTVVEGIAMESMLVDGAYKVELPTYVHAFKIVGDGYEGAEILASDVVEGETYNLSGKHLCHQYDENKKCTVCGADAAAPIVVWEESFEIGETFERVDTQNTPTTSDADAHWNNAAPKDEYDFFLLDHVSGGNVFVTGGVDGAYDGNSCIKLDGESANSRLYLTYHAYLGLNKSNISLVDGEKYVASVWVKFDETSAMTFQLLIKNTAHTSNPKTSVASKDVEANKWVQIFLPFTYTTEKNLQINMEMLSVTKGAVYLDKLQILKAEDATGITVDESAALHPGESIQLTPLLSPATATEKITCTWESSDENVAKVDANGKVTGIRNGVATVKVTATKWEYDYDKRAWVKTATQWTAQCVVTVTATSPVVVFEDSFEIGETFTVEGVTNTDIIGNNDDNWYGATPINKDTFAADLYNGAPSAKATGGVGGAFDGDSCIKLEAPAGYLLYMVYNLKGANKPALEDGKMYVLSVWVKYDADSGSRYSQLQIKNTTAAVTGGNVNPRIDGGKNLTEWTKLEVPFLYTDANDGKLSVNLNMQSTAGTGAVYFDLLQITELIEATADFTVSGAEEPMNVGDKVALDPNMTPENASTTIIWTSSDSSVATVDANGVVTAVGEGSATITATAVVKQYDFVNRKYIENKATYIGTCEVTVTGDLA